MDSAVEAVNQHVWNYLKKPLDISMLRQVLTKHAKNWTVSALRELGEVSANRTRVAVAAWEFDRNAQSASNHRAPCADAGAGTHPW